MIVLENVSKTFDAGRTFSVRDLSLHVPPGKLLALLGGSGCGKTTTLKMINRLHDPTSGRIAIGGCDVRQTDAVQLRRSIGYVIQGSGLFPHMTVAENVAVVPKLLGWDRLRIAKRVAELLELVKLPDRSNSFPRELSGGQQQRIGFARALAVEPKVVLLDEPFGALDPKTRIELRNEFTQIRRRLSLTAVMVTHDMLEALLSADLIAVMKDGLLQQIGTARELIERPANDYVRELINSPRGEIDNLEALYHPTIGAGHE